MTGSTVDLDVLRVVGWGGVGQPARPNVEVFSALAALNRRERLNHVLVVRGRCQGLLQGRRLVIVAGGGVELGVEGRQRGPVDGDGGLRHL